MTIKDYISNLEKKQKELNSLSEKALEIAANATRDVMADRIFQKGQNNTGDTFNYSTEPAIIGNLEGVKKIVPNKIPKNSKVFRFQSFIGARYYSSKTRSGNKSIFGYWGRFFPNGYYEYRKFIGLQNNYVRYSLSGKLNKRFDSGLKKINKNKYILAFRDERSRKLKKLLDNQYSAVFSISKNEREYFNETYQKYVFYLNEIYDR